MDYQVIWTDPALEDLQNIVTFIATNNINSARRLGDHIIDHTDLLTSFPNMGTAYDSTGQLPVRETVCTPYRIFYRVNEDRRIVEIMHIRHSARSEPSL